MIKTEFGGGKKRSKRIDRTERICNMVKNLFVVELSRGLNGTYAKSNPDNGMYQCN